MVKFVSFSLSPWNPPVCSSPWEKGVTEGMFGAVWHDTDFVHDYHRGSAALGNSEKKDFKVLEFLSTEPKPFQTLTCVLPFNPRMSFWKSFNQSFSFAWREASSDTWPLPLLLCEKQLWTLPLCQFPREDWFFSSVFKNRPFLTFHISCHDPSVLSGTQNKRNISKHSASDNWGFFLRIWNLILKPTDVAAWKMWILVFGRSW